MIFHQDSVYISRSSFYFLTKIWYIQIDKDKLSIRAKLLKNKEGILQTSRKFTNRSTNENTEKYKESQEYYTKINYL